MNCLKAVILLWTGIIVFHASVTAIVVDDMEISAVKINTCRGVFESFEVEFALIRNERTQQHLYWAGIDPKSTHGARERLIITFKQSPCNEEIQSKFQKIESPVKV
ncbi:uncharacterized protein LOC107885125 [Acyrthosiphon pisum]|uniref:Uncharacterized protein n=1 Tax=Acyrthosiphon pisum TaxID=7029 RepID=A0A8R2HC09_ACYPI|nr:uncharacterized protein LOC107885125 [Acyrthosiphon pisum]|eukprot:XP_016664098.1 PREDICTED: uncharacterized protein LOC107885125 [Acyrthosiphon pisum]